jgi:hypothetical protein
LQASKFQVLIQGEFEVEDNQSVVGNALPGVPSQDGSTGQASTGQAVSVTARTADATFPTATPPPVQAGTQLEARLRAHLKKHDGKSELLFVNRRARPFSANKLREKQLHPLLVKLGIPRGGFHSMRHGAASALLADGATPAVVQRQLRHSDPRITLGIYGHVVGNQQRDAVENRSARIAKFAA